MIFKTVSVGENDMYKFRNIMLGEYLFKLVNLVRFLFVVLLFTQETNGVFYVKMGACAVFSITI